eukprot:TRINITY_DN1791_c0_g2_i3.p1 TRINITY_DN1791_c0_g2~~TRINITY_DN1791_c0_g2_i3.p1  ORF type:complete len:729 (+),score=166.26 TRINITY_DN1791_c0_g2_i3:90-2276(+)
MDKRKLAAKSTPIKSISVNINFVPKTVDIDSKIKLLEEATRAIQCNRPNTTCREELYQVVKLVCDERKGDVLAALLQQSIEFQVTSILSQPFVSSSDLLEVLASFNRAWDDYYEKLSLIRNIYIYLERSFIRQHRDFKSLYDMGLDIFREGMQRHKSLLEKIIDGLVFNLQAIRDGEQIDADILKVAVKVISDLQLYEHSFQKPFLQSSDVYYSNEGNQKSQSLEIGDYLLYCEKRIKDEAEKARAIYGLSSKRQVSDILDQCLLKKHIESVLERGFDSLMEHSRIEDLSRLYLLMVRVQKLDVLKRFFVRYIKLVGTSLVQDVEREPTLVQDLLDFKEKIDRITKDCFSSHEIFVHATKDSFESFVNSRQNKPAELIAKFIDSKLRSGNKESSDDEMEALLDKVLILFRFIQGKDVFEAFYKKDLGKRLLLGKSASNDLEKSMISKLKAECGAEFTMKLEGMFKDIDMSKDFMDTFKQSRLASTLSKNVDMFVHVLSSAYWIAEPPMSILIPQELVPFQEAFNNFYKLTHNGRQLHWQHTLGHCVVRAILPLGNKELTVSFVQTIVLLLFNDRPNLTFKEIKEGTSIEDKELRRTLQSLACGKVRVLQKSPKGRDVDDDDSFAVNTEFSNKLTKIKINSIQLKETPEENKAITEKVYQDRQYLVDAAIVRIMKTRKVLGHNLLMSEIIGQLKFQAKPQDVKKRIESLIEREYLERDKADSNTYHYLA